MYKLITTVSALFFAALITVGLARLPSALAECAEENSVDLDEVEDSMTVLSNGEFEFKLTGSWELEEDPAWVVIETAPSGGSINVEDQVYVPAFLFNEECMGSEVFTVTGNLKVITEDGVENSRLTVDPGGAGNLTQHATFIPAAQ